MTTRVNIEYAQNSGFEPRVRHLEKEIRMAVPNAQISTSHGRPDAFEVTVNDKLIFSRLQTKDFPVNDLIVQQVKAICDESSRPGFQQGGMATGTGIGAGSSFQPSVGSSSFQQPSSTLGSSSLGTSGMGSSGLGPAATMGASSGMGSSGVGASSYSGLGGTSTTFKPTDIGSSAYQQPLGSSLSSQQQPMSSGMSREIPVSGSPGLQQGSKAPQASYGASARDVSPEGEKKGSKMRSGEELGLQQGPKARQQREYRVVPEGDMPFQGPPVGQQSTEMGQSHPYGSIGSQATDKSYPYQERGNVPAAEGTSSSLSGQQEKPGLVSRILGAVGLGKHGDKDADTEHDRDRERKRERELERERAKGANRERFEPTLVPTEQQREEFEKFKQAGHIPNQQDIGQHRSERSDFKDQGLASGQQSGYAPSQQSGSFKQTGNVPVQQSGSFQQPSMSVPVQSGSSVQQPISSIPIPSGGIPISDTTVTETRTIPLQTSAPQSQQQSMKVDIQPNYALLEKQREAQLLQQGQKQELQNELQRQEQERQQQLQKQMREQQLLQQKQQQELRQELTQQQIEQQRIQQELEREQEKERQGHKQLLLQQQQQLEQQKKQPVVVETTTVHKESKLKPQIEQQLQQQTQQPVVRVEHQVQPQQTLGMASREIPVTAQPAMQSTSIPVGSSIPMGTQMPVSQSSGARDRRDSSSSSSSSSSSDAERAREKEHAAQTQAKERSAIVDQPGVPVAQKHNMDEEQIQAIRGAGYLRRENVREQT